MFSLSRSLLAPNLKDVWVLTWDRQGLKPPSMGPLYGTTKVVPFRKDNSLRSG